MPKITLEVVADLLEKLWVSVASMVSGQTDGTQTTKVTQETASSLNANVTSNGANLATAAKQLPDGHEVKLPTSQITTLTPPAAITGFATSAKQLADGHNVAVTNMIAAVETGLAKSLIQTDGTQRASISGRNIGKTAQVSPMRALSTFDQIRLCGTPFHGTTKDPNFWSETGTGTNGSITQAGGQVVLAVTTDSGSAAVYTSIRTGRYVSGSSNKFRAVVRFPDLGTPANNNVREFGAFTATDGFLFQLNANVFNIVVRKTGTADQVIAKASWTGTYAAAFTLDTNVHTYEIQWTNSSAWFFIDDNIMHTVKGDTAPSTATLSFPVCARNINTLIGPAVSINVRTMAILRMGQQQTVPQYKNITGNAATWVLKYGPGTLHKIIFNNTTGTSLAIWDGLTGAAPSVAIGKITTTTDATGAWDYNCPFFNGLTIVTVGNDLDATITYE